MTPRIRPQARGLTFNKGNHQYRLDGNHVPGVTTIIGCLDKPALVKWAAGLVAEFVADEPDKAETLLSIGRDAFIKACKDLPDARRTKAGDRGTTIHDIAEKLLLGEEVDVPDELVPVAENLLEFFDDWHIDPILLEQPVGSREHRYAGTFDLIARYRRPDTGETGIAMWDYKSGKVIYPEAAMQLAGYHGAEFYGLNGDENPIPPIDAAFGVHARADGYDVIPLKHGPDVFAEFVTIRHTFDAAKRMRGDWKTPGSGYAGIAIRKDYAA